MDRLSHFLQIHTFAGIPQQTLQQSTETPWSELELYYAHLRQSLPLIEGEEKSEVEKHWEGLAQQWKKQQVGLKSRFVCYLFIYF